MIHRNPDPGDGDLDGGGAPSMASPYNVHARGIIVRRMFAGLEAHLLKAMDAIDAFEGVGMAA